jgi:hypothetical protein
LQPPAGFFVKTDLIDRIYECSLVPDLWPGVLDELANLADSRIPHSYGNHWLLGKSDVKFESAAR